MEVTTGLDPMGVRPATVTDATLYGKGPFGGVKGIATKFLIHKNRRILFDDLKSSNLAQ